MGGDRWGTDLRSRCCIARADVFRVWGVAEVNAEVITIGERADEKKKKYSDL